MTMSSKALTNPVIWAFQQRGDNNIDVNWEPSSQLFLVRIPLPKLSLPMASQRALQTVLAMRRRR